VYSLTLTMFQALRSWESIELTRENINTYALVGKETFDVVVKVPFMPPSAHRQKHQAGAIVDLFSQRICEYSVCSSTEMFPFNV